MTIGRTLILGLLLAIGAAPGAAQDGRMERVAIVGADVLPMTGRARLPDQIVLVVGDRIERVGPRAQIRIPEGYRVIDGKGQTLMPGLVDMHIHLSAEAGRPGDASQRALAVMLAHGVTTARTMAGHPAHPEIRAAIERGTIAGPRLYAAAPALHDGNVPDATAGRAAVAAAKGAGYDLIKSHQLTDPVRWQAIQDEARRLRIPVAGHVAKPVGLLRAVAAGQQIEHLDGAIAELIGADAPEQAIDFGQFPPGAVLDAAAAADESAYRALAARLARSGSWHVPTLSLFETIADVTTPTVSLRARADMRFIPEAALDAWAKQRDSLRQMLDADSGRKLIDVRRRLVRALHRAGVPLMAGSDTAQAFQIWGPGLIAEIEALGRAGLSNMDALRSATRVPRDYLRNLPGNGSALGWRASFGTIEAGARADLLLLDADPSKNLSALRSVRTVVAGGRVYERAQLDALLERAAVDAKAPRDPPMIASQSLYVMRHLQRGEGSDPPLSEEGLRNAGRLHAVLAQDPPAAIYVSRTRRAQETVAALAKALGLTPKLYDPGNPQALIDVVARETGTVLIVGHSNTVPDIVQRLGGTAPAPLGEADFGDIWHVVPSEKRTERIRIPD
jgi:imidazolonepropionase-like amidohydrolase/phosphohistidine phosphatase SixA